MRCRALPAPGPRDVRVPFPPDRPGGRVALLAALALMLAWPGRAQDVPDLSGASRILSIGGSLTEIVYALGEGERLIARDATSVYPDAALDLPDVGYLRALSPEGTLSFAPDGIIMLETSGPPGTVEVLQATGLPLLMVPETHDLEGITGKVRLVGRALGVEDRAEALARRIEAEIAGVSADTPGGPPRILFVMSMEAGKIMASGSDTAADGIIRLVGGENAITGYSGYRQLTDEALIAAAPDVILTMQVDEADLAGVDELRGLPAIAATPAGRAGRVYAMDGAYLLGFGPRTAAAVRDLAAILDAGIHDIHDSD